MAYIFGIFSLLIFLSVGLTLARDLGSLNILCCACKDRAYPWNT